MPYTLVSTNNLQQDHRHKHSDTKLTWGHDKPW